MLLIAMALVATPAPESAGERAWRACVDRTTTNYDWAKCGGEYVRRADAALNAEWNLLLALAEGKTRANLLAEERAWITYRTKACEFYADGEQGREGQVLHYQGCVAGVIERRTAELAAYRRDLAGPQ